MGKETNSDNKYFHDNGGKLADYKQKNSLGRARGTLL